MSPPPTPWRTGACYRHVAPPRATRRAAGTAKAPPFPYLLGQLVRPPAHN